MPNFHRFTIKAQEALQSAQEMVSRENHGELRAIHLLASLLEDEQTLVRPMLVRGGVDLGALERALEEALHAIPKIFAMGGGVGQLYLSQELMKILDYAADVA
ncbi:MAG: Clp protease N-terminal domain-containing protein, partial [Candidatus Jorgensenbacteria bacterium]